MERGENMDGMIKDIEEKARQNTFFRHVLENGNHCQVVLMSIAPGTIHKTKEEAEKAEY